MLDDDEGVEDVTKSIVSSIVESEGLQHPIISNSYNICELVHKNELKSLSIRVIKDMDWIWTSIPVVLRTSERRHNM